MEDSEDKGRTAVAAVGAIGSAVETEVDNFGATLKGRNRATEVKQ